MDDLKSHDECTHSIFISYCRSDTDTDSMVAFIEKIRELLPSWIKIKFDRKSIDAGENFEEFMACASKCPVCIVFLTPEYKERTSLRGNTGVRFEYLKIIERYESDNDIKIIPVLFSGDRSKSIPEEISKLNYLDFRTFKATRSEGKISVSNSVRNDYRESFGGICQICENYIRAVNLSSDTESEKILNRLFVNTKTSFQTGKLDPDFYSEVFYEIRSFKEVSNQNVYFIIGRKGSGKSTIVKALSSVKHQHYKTAINLSAEQINLLEPFELVNLNKIEIANRKLESAQRDISVLTPRVVMFKYAWLGLIYIAICKEIKNLSVKGRLNEKQKAHLTDFNKHFETFFGEGSQYSRSEALFSSCCLKCLELWENSIDQISLDEEIDESKFNRLVRLNFNEEAYLRNLLSGEFLDAVRLMINNCDKKTLITLDDFDTIFDTFRRKSNRSSGDVDHARFEADWLQALCLLVLELKGVRDGWTDEIVEHLDFCITIPKDRYYEIVRNDRDGYLYGTKTVKLEWSGIDLSRMLSMRIGYMFKDGSDRYEKSSEIALSNVQQKYLSKIPDFIEFKFNGKPIRISLYCYVLRHTFWRPRDIIKFYARLMVAANQYTEEGTLPVETIRKIVALNTKEILKTEFLDEYDQVLYNLRLIKDSFFGCNQLLGKDEIWDIIKDIKFITADENDGDLTFLKKLNFLYDIGFIGLRLSSKLMSIEKVDISDVFYFNEGSTVFRSAEKADFKNCKFIIHPIFVENLHLNTSGMDFVLNLDWNYLRTNSLIKHSNLALL